MWDGCGGENCVDSLDGNLLFNRTRSDIFMDEVIVEAQTPVEAVRMFESHLLDNTAKRVSYNLWMELLFDMFEMSRALRNEEVTHEKVLNDLRTEISELANIRPGSENSADVMIKTVAAVQGIEAFSLICRDPKYSYKY